MTYYLCLYVILIFGLFNDVFATSIPKLPSSFSPVRKLAFYDPSEDEKKLTKKTNFGLDDEDEFMDEDEEIEITPPPRKNENSDSYTERPSSTGPIYNPSSSGNSRLRGANPAESKAKNEKAFEKVRCRTQHLKQFQHEELPEYCKDYIDVSSSGVQKKNASPKVRHKK